MPMSKLLGEYLEDLNDLCSENSANQQPRNEIRTQTKREKAYGTGSSLFDNMSPPDCVCEHQSAGFDLLPSHK